MTVKTIRFISAALIALASFTSCVNSIEISNVSEAGMVEFNVTADSEACATKTELGSDNQVLWQEDDNIGILSKSYYDSLTIVSGVGNTIASFSGYVHDTDEDRIAVYPYIDSDDTRYDGNESPYVTLVWEENNIGSSTQVALKGGFMPSSALMAGRVATDRSVAFKNLLAFVKFTIDFSCSAVTITSNLGEYLASEVVKFRFDDNGVPINISIVQPYSKSTSVTLSGMNGEDLTPGTYYIGVLPQTLEEGFTLSFEMPDGGGKRRKSTSKAVTFKRSGILNLGTIKYSDTATYDPDAEFDGEGTPSEPYRISSKQMILKLAELLNDNATYSSYADKYYLQTVDIDCGGDTLCIGSRSHPFKGTYNGGNHTIGNFVAGCVNGRCGLFGTLHNAVVRQLTSAPKSFAVVWPENKYAYCGGLAAVVTADDGKQVTLQDCHLKSPEGTLSIPMTDDYYLDFGGMIGKCSCDLVMYGCDNETNLKTYVQGKYDNSNYNLVSVGGLVGRVDSQGKHYIKINCCRNLGGIEANHVSGVTAGGIIGEMVEGATGDDEMCLYLTNAVNRGNITAISAKWNSANAGGLVGNHDADGWFGADPYICNCLNAGDVLATGRDGCAGGLMGKCYDSNTKVYCCANIGNVSGIYPGMSELDQADLKDYRKLGALCGSDGGYYYYCRWSNNSDMPIVFKGTKNVENSIYVNAVTAAMMMNDMRPELVKAGTPTGVTYVFWVIDDNGLDLDF